MNKAKLKSYAPQARKDFIAAVTARANLLGLSEKAGKLEVAPSQPQGDATVIAGQAWPVKVHSQRQQLISRIQKVGFAQTMEAVAYTWFNRFAALRYMELHDYLGHGHRALSSLEGTLPDILTHAADLAQSGANEGGLPGLKPALVVEMKLAGNRDGELYSMLLVAQCNALSNVMPFLFERIDDETELLLPDNLLRTDSVVAKLVASIEEEDWNEVEIIGWLYQFYISEKKDEVIGKVVKSEDIPAATQLFTPNWIVQYLVQNSVGRLWLMANPASTLKAQWPYYIAPADQTLEVQAQLDALIQTRVNEDGDSLNPESITLLDPACGSGHILVEAYEVLKAIYLERGYQPRSIPRLILEKNLYGLDIDDRAAQMAGFALLMKARSDDRRLFNEPIKLNVLSLQESKGLNADELIQALQLVVGSVNPKITADASASGGNDGDLFSGSRAQFGVAESRAAYMVGDPVWRTIASLIATFAHAKTLGSLIQIPQMLNAQLTTLAERLQRALSSGDLYAQAAALCLWPLVEQARVLGMQFDAVVANPPYMGGNGMNSALKEYAKSSFPDSKSDLFAMFIERGFGWCKATGFNSMVTMQSWMFLSSYQLMREKLLLTKTLSSMTHMGNGVMGIAFGTAATIFLNRHVDAYAGSFSYCENGDVNERGVPAQFPVQNERLKTTKSDDFKKIPGNPISYWIGATVRDCWGKPLIRESLEIRSGLLTGNDNKFLRHWYEVSFQEIYFKGIESEVPTNYTSNWIPVTSGGGFRKWYGNVYQVVKAKNDFSEIKSLEGNNYRLRDSKYYFKTGINWPMISSCNFGAKISPDFAVMGNGVRTGFVKSNKLFMNESLTGFLSSNVAFYFMSIINPTLNFNNENVEVIPCNANFSESFASRCKAAIVISENDWNSSEFSFFFHRNPLIESAGCNLKNSYDIYLAEAKKDVSELLEIEQKNNEELIYEYGLSDIVSPIVSSDAITLYRNSSYRYGNVDNADVRFQCDIVRDLLSYAIGCMMGRYSLDEPGLIYANAGNIGFDDSRYASFPADFDGIVPLTDELWFEDEAASRIREFLLVVWGADTLAENIAWLAESLGNKAGETPDETIRRYLADKFYKDHLQTYKKRPIYWLFSSGKQGAFQALVYLHRYHEGTLSRMRAEYVVPLTGKIQSRIDMLEKDAVAASSTAARNKLSKEVEKLRKKHVELLAYDEQLRHYADMRITLDLDDGVKVNYGKFGDLLAEVKAVTGGSDD